MHERFDLDVPEEIWDQIISLLDDDQHLEPLSLVSKLFLSITNRLKKTLIISNPTAHFLPKLLYRFPNLKNISLSEFTGDPTSIIELFSQTQFPLLSLDLSNHAQFPCDAIKLLPISSLRSIRSLNLSNCCFVNDEDLGVIAELMVNLEELDVSNPRDDYDCGYEYNVDVVMEKCGGVGITDDGVELIACNLSHLRKVNLSKNGLVSDKCIVSLVEKCVHLEDIVVKECPFITQNGVVFACRHCKNLRFVGLLGMELTVPEMSEALCFAQNLSVLHFECMTVSDGLLYAIAKASIPLKKFTLMDCKDFTFSGVLSLLRTYQSLEYFALEGVYWVTDRTIIDISKFLRKAKTVRFNFCSRVTSSGLFTILKNCYVLDSLNLEKTNVGIEEFAVNDAKNTQIRHLCLSGNKTLSNECLEKVAMCCPNLDSIDVSDCPNINRKGIGEVVRKCSKLRHLLIIGCGAIKSLGIDTKLHNLQLIHASRSGLTDDGLVTIAKKCPGLLHLDLAGCGMGLTSKGIKEIIFHCPRLREISLCWCRGVGRDIVPWMVFARPSLRKIVPPFGVVITEVEKNLFLQHGCLVGEA